MVLHWVKESPTLDLEVTYIDDIDGGLLLKWSSQDEWYQCEAALSLGQHSGCLTLGRRDTILPIKTFFVEQGAPSPQKIVISTGHNRIAIRVPQAGELARALPIDILLLLALCSGASCDGERDRGGHDS